MQTTETMQVDFSPLMEFLSEKFEKIDRRFEGIDEKFRQIDLRFEQIDKRFDVLEKRLDDMPTKTYIHNILAELEGRYTTMHLKSGYKVTRLAEILVNKGIIASHDLKELDQIPLKSD
jgi:predicted transcriptional regulator